MGDDNTVNVVLREQLIYALGEFKPVLVAHVLAGNLKYLFTLDVGDFLQFWDGLNQALHPDGRRGVADGGGLPLRLCAASADKCRHG